MDKEKILQAGEIASQVRNFIKPQIKKGVPLLEIAEKLESKIIELGGRMAFPTNLSINEVAAHYTPSHDDETLASGILKVDFGVCIDGWLSDTAFSVDLENSEENKKLILASEKALENAIKIFKEGNNLDGVGKEIENVIGGEGFSPVTNLSGHSMDKYDLHSGVTVPNIKDKVNYEIKKGLYAIEPFATTGNGKVRDGKASGIYILQDEKNIRSPIAREILSYIIEEYSTLPFCSRWIVKKFGTRAMIGLKQLEENGNLHQFAQLIEEGKGKVSQTEHTVFVGDEVVVTTK